MSNSMMTTTTTTAATKTNGSVVDGSSSSQQYVNKKSMLRTTGVVVILLAVVVQITLRSPTLLHWFDRFVLDALQERKHHLANHIFLNGNYAPVAEEHDRVPLEVVEGALPKDLDGLFLRNGPNPIPSHIFKRYHWFDGHGMLHSVRIIQQSKSATYTNQYIPTPRYLIEKKWGAEVFPRIGEFTGITGIIKAIFIAPFIAKAHGLSLLTIGPANTQTIMYKNKFWCGQEASLPFDVQLDNFGKIIKVVGFEDFGGAMDYPVSAHPKIDHVTGNLIFHGYSSDPALMKRYGSLVVGEYDAKRHQLLSFLGVMMPDDDNNKKQHTSFAHDMLFTKNYIVVYDSSVHFDATKIMEPNASFFDFRADASLRIGLVPRRSSSNTTQGDGGNNNQTTMVTQQDVIWIDTGVPHFIVHQLNAWEESDGTVVIWSPVSDDFDESMHKTAVFYMTEFRIDPKSKRLLSKRQIDTKYNVEFTRMRDDCLGRFCRFGYGGILSAAELDDDILYSGFTVWDMEKGKLHKAVFYPNGEGGQEPVVIPKPGRHQSNAVYLGTFLYSPKDQQSYFVLYDGENDYSLVAKLRIPYRVPYGFHGQWVTGAELQAHIDDYTNKSST